MSDRALGKVQSVDPGKLAHNQVFEWFARGGFVVSGLLHLIIGYVAIRIALGANVPAGTADQTGALATLAAKPGGPAALWVAAFALLMLGLWRLAETALGKASDRGKRSSAPGLGDRAKALALAVLYFGFASTAFGFARGAGKSAGEQNVTLSARLMQSTAGTIAVVAGGLVVLVVGGYHVYKGATRKFLDDLEGSGGTWVRRLGTVGYIAKGVVIFVAGALVIVAAFRSDPAKAAGLDGALKTLGAQPYGTALLIAAGLGIIVYGLYSFVMARSTKM